MNFEKIKKINEILNPFYTLEINDIYGDRGSCILPKIEELTTLHYKKRSKDIKGKPLFISKNDEKILIEKLKELNIGNIDQWYIQSIGRFIVIEPNYTS